MNMVHSHHNGWWTIQLIHRTKRIKRIPKEEEKEAQSGGNGTQMVLPLNDALNGTKSDDYSAFSLHNSLSTIRLINRTKRSKQNHKVEETEAQTGENDTMMVLPLTGTLRDQNVMNMVHSFHNNLWTIRLLQRTNK